MRLFVLSLFVCASAASAYDEPFKVIGGGAFRPGSIVRFALDPAGSADIDGDADLDALRDAFRAWSCVEGASLRFDEDDAPGPAEVNLSDGINTLFWDEDGRCGMGPGTLGITVGEVGGANRAQADICFNGVHSTWGIGRDTDVGSVAIHEIGHFIGLDHPCDGNTPNETNCNLGDVSIMTPAWDGVPSRVPLPDDEAGARALYPVEEGDASSCTGPFRAGERCACNDECVEGLICLPDVEGTLRCGKACSLDNVDCGEGAVCVLEAPTGKSASGTCVTIEGQRPAASVCNNDVQCLSGLCSVDFDLGAKICVVPCDADDDCAGGTCLGEEGARRCYGGFSGTACPVAEPPEGCGCSAATASSSSSSSSSLTGAVALLGLGGALLRRRRRA